MRVLIIEDDTLIANAILRIINLDFKGEVAASKAVGTVQEGIAALETFLPNVILFDVRLPDGTGFDILRVLPADHIAVKVCISGQPTNDIMNEFAKEGVYLFIAKPFDVVQLRESLQSALLELRQRQQQRTSFIELLENHDKLHAIVREQEQEIMTLKQSEPSAADGTTTGIERQETTTKDAESVESEMEQDTPTLLLTLRIDGEDHRVGIPIAEILYIEARGSKIAVIRRNGEALEATRTLKALEEQLAENDFLRCHASYLVNCRAVGAYSASSLTLGTVKVPISRKYQPNVRQRMAELFGKKR